jgi:hypothetical protein
MGMTSATPAARTAAQLPAPAHGVARLAAPRCGHHDVQAAVTATSQRLELAITKAEDLLSGDAGHAESDGSCNLFKQVCTEMTQAARDYLRATRLAGQCRDGGPRNGTVNRT